MSDKQDRRSADEIEDEIRQTRENLDDTLHELEDRLSPKYFMDSAYNQIRNGGANEFIANLGNTVKHNPIPVLLIGIGVGWLMMSQNRSGQKSSDRSMGRHRHDTEGRYSKPGTVMPATSSEAAPHASTVTGANRPVTTAGTGMATTGSSMDREVVGEATHLGTAQHKGGQPRPGDSEVIGEPTHLGTRQHRDGSPGSKM
ncbi:DUF3618 domain-containing protein [Halomonas sp. McH1-25]|uniref:DUF3618 domain-containing protein n=1 Tax=unclassified Halomonas TaxID=2609666 RepID=UPI001EF56D80|nr:MULTISPECIES: DUF3618 domain-containing protein [unclassified Halomonas]MCG7599342.1 DUF3618 domain-containing protein [Halomonas sp. McH1-25]MCP1343832.1 DUF3618 domain-containing protein [Halomonas sp. FL8]MCP1361123.1 DUF3618 domain-containing protein [Halomonas sp. BBD45]MCP1363830.1 DUF3618 domain-containing protein [Halomonas sp. BBD48]